MDVVKRTGLGNGDWTDPGGAEARRKRQGLWFLAVDQEHVVERAAARLGEARQLVRVGVARDGGQIIRRPRQTAPSASNPPSTAMIIGADGKS